MSKFIALNWKNVQVFVKQKKNRIWFSFLFKVRRVWKDYFPAVDAIVFLIDAWDRQRFGESINELQSILSDEQLSECPIVILGNKIDKIGAAGEHEVRQLFNLNGITTGKVSKKKKFFFYTFSFPRDPSDFSTKYSIERWGKSLSLSWIPEN